jgi:hypothetical protein
MNAPLLYGNENARDGVQNKFIVHPRQAPNGFETKRHRRLILKN